jgi:AraC-like DNA-binding protein
MKFEKKELYKEQSVHGNVLFPLHVYRNEYGSKHDFLHYHWHDELEFIFMHEGCYKFLIGSETVTLTQGQAAIVNSADIHSGLGGITETGIYYSIVFAINMLKGSYQDLCYQDYIQPLEAGIYRFPLLIEGKEAWQERVLKEIHEIINCFETRPKAYPLFIKSSLFRICSELLSNSVIKTEEETDRDKKLYFSRFKKIIEFIEKNYPQKILIKDLAGQINVNEDYFYQLFRNMTGKTPVQYINQVRVNKAAFLLNDTDLSVTQVAEKTGFDNVSYFIRTFKKYKNCTPLKYRKNLP